LIRVRPLARSEYLPSLQAMRDFTATREPSSQDEIWLVEHPPVFTLGLAGKLEHVLTPGAVPVIRTERGGQVTFHGPGQVVAYTLIDLRRRRMTVRTLVDRLEQAVIDTCSAWAVEAVRKPGAPGVYVAGPGRAPGAKIAALGLRIARGCSYHGVSLNVAMDLSPFECIDPCGYAGQPVTDLARAAAAARPPDLATVARGFGESLAATIERA
jgi:lipoyl(octanoyl) transferase